MEALSDAYCDPFSSCRDDFEKFVKDLSIFDGDFSDIESRIDTQGMEILRKLLETKVNQSDNGTSLQSVEGADGYKRTHKRVGTRKIKTLFGDIQVDRVLFSTKAAGNDGAIAPKDEKLNLPKKKYSHNLQNLAAKSAAKCSFDSAKDDLLRFKRQSLPKRAIEQLCVSAAQDFESFYGQRSSDKLQAITKDADFTVITTDGKGIVLHKDDLRATTKKAAENEPKNKRNKRLGKGEKKNRKRMAQVVSVYNVNRHVRSADDIVNKSEENNTKRPKIQGKRVWAGIREDATDTIAQGFAEVDHRDPNKKTTLVGLVDGNANQIADLEEQAEQSGRDICIIIDLIHVIEYLWKASRSFYGETDGRCQQFVEKYLKMLLTAGPSQTAKGIRSRATRAELSKEERAAADKACDYMLKLRKYMQYSKYIKAGMPIGTGVIEGACRHLICDRLDITGARWRLDSAEAILRLRSIMSSGDWDEYSDYHHKNEQFRNHTSRVSERQRQMQQGLRLV